MLAHHINNRRKCNAEKTSMISDVLELYALRKVLF